MLHRFFAAAKDGVDGRHKHVLLRLRLPIRSFRTRPYHTALTIKTGGKVWGIIGAIMEDTVRKSCWGVTVRAVIGFAGLLALVYLFGGI